MPITNVNVHGAFGALGTTTQGCNQNDGAKNITTVEEFATFLKENGTKIEQSASSLILYVGGGGMNKVGSQIWTRPDPGIEIYVYVHSDDWKCGIDFNNLPESITVKGPVSSAIIPKEFLTKDAIQKAYIGPR